MLESSALTSIRSSTLPVIAALVAIAIFVVDTFSPLTDAVASLYVVVVLLSASFLRSRGVLLVSAGCVVLAIAAYFLQHWAEPLGDALVRLLVSLTAIVAVSFLALKNQTARKVAEDRARLLDLTHDTIFVRDMKDRITYWNRGSEQLYGWSAGEALGRSSHELQHTEFPVPLEAINAELLRTGRWEGELVHVRRDGQRVVVASRWSLQRDDHGNPVAVLETNNDITDRKHAEEALTRSQAYLTEAQRLSRTGSFGWNFSTGDTVWTEETYRIFGVDQAMEPTLELALQRTHPDDMSYVRSQLNRAARELKDFEFKNRLLLPDGSVKHVHTVARAMKDPSGNTEFVGAVTDVTATQLAEEALYKSQAELLHVTRVTTLGELTASIAHEVNQPLAAIVTNGEVSLRLLEQEPPDLAELQDAVGAMIADGRRASDIIQRLRALSKKSESEKAALTISNVIEEVIPLVQGQVSDHRASLRLELTPELVVLGDRVQLQQVIINLIVNAVEAMDPITGRPRDVLVRSGPDGPGQVLVAVEDSGVGIEPEHAKRLFSAFYSTKPGGMGMGLSISHSIIENHGGRLWASSNTGPGATFQFTLPKHEEAKS